jgi:hypothetical protein
MAFVQGNTRENDTAHDKIAGVLNDIKIPNG